MAAKRTPRKTVKPAKAPRKRRGGKGLTLYLPPALLDAISSAAEGAGLYTDTRYGARGTTSPRPHLHAALTGLLEQLARMSRESAARYVREGVALYDGTAHGQAHKLRFCQAPAGRQGPPVERYRGRKSRQE